MSRPTPLAGLEGQVAHLEQQIAELRAELRARDAVLARMLEQIVAQHAPARRVARRAAVAGEPTIVVLDRPAA